jgi:hypothetical protein
MQIRFKRIGTSKKVPGGSKTTRGQGESQSLPYVSHIPGSAIRASLDIEGRCKSRSGTHGQFPIGSPFACSREFHSSLIKNQSFPGIDNFFYCDPVGGGIGFG